MNICITGVSRGLGLALCEEFLARGHGVWGISRSGPPPMAHPAFHWTSADVSSGDDLRTWQQEMQQAGFTPDMLILNASVQHDDMQDAYDHEAGQAVLAVNLGGALRCIGLFLPGFLQRGSGTFLAISSTAALRPSRRSASYAASKAGLTMALRSLALRYRSSGVRFQIVTLGPIQTEMWEGRRSWFVPPARDAARAIARFALRLGSGPAAGSGSATFSYPFLSTTLLRLACFLPDRMFSRISSFLLK